MYFLGIFTILFLQVVNGQSCTFVQGVLDCGGTNIGRECKTDLVQYSLWDCYKKYQKKWEYFRFSSVFRPIFFRKFPKNSKM